MGSIRPAIDDTDLSTEVVGALSMADLGPFGRSPLRLLFVVAAAVVAIGRGELIAGNLGIGGPLDVAAFAGVSAATETLVVLLPVALLWRVPAAPRTHPMLLGGLALGALVEVLRLGSAIVPAMNRKLSSCLSSISKRLGTPATWMWQMWSMLSRSVRVMSPSAI